MSRASAKLTGFRSITIHDYFSDCSCLHYIGRFLIRALCVVELFWSFCLVDLCEVNMYAGAPTPYSKFTNMEGGLLIRRCPEGTGIWL